MFEETTRRRLLRPLTGLSMAAAAIVAACSSGPSPNATPTPAPPSASPVTRYARAGNPILVTDDGARASFSRDGNWLYYDRIQPNGCAAINKIRPDGTENTCITCDNPSLPGNTGLAEESPDGKWLVFLSERPDKPCSQVGTGPGGGAFQNLWVRNQATGEVTQLTDVSDTTGGSLHPHWSASGDKILWTDRTSKQNGIFGTWQLAIADFVPDPHPSLRNITYYTPARGFWYESHGWALDDTRIYFTCTDFPDQNDFYQDACYMDFSDTSTVTRLTQTSGLNGEPSVWDEHLALSPRNDVYVWMTSMPYDCPSGPVGINQGLKTELWMMNTDGSGQTRMTWFNDESHTDPTDWQNAGPAVLSKISWDPTNANRLVAYVQFNCETGNLPCSSEHPQRLFLIDFIYNP